MAKAKTSSKVNKAEDNGTITFTMKKDKETKGAVRYNETGDGGKNVYFRKEELEKEFGEFPESLEVSIKKG